MEKTTLMIILNVIIIFCHEVLTTKERSMTTNSQTKMNNDATSRKLFETSQSDMIKSSLITHIQFISSNIERSSTLQELNFTSKSTWQEVQIRSQTTLMRNISSQTPYRKSISNYTKSLQLQTSEVFSSPSILAQRTAVFTKSYLTSSLVSTKRKEENTSKTKQYSMTSSKQYIMTSSKQYNITSTEHYDMSSTTPYNMTSTKQHNVTSSYSEYLTQKSLKYTLSMTSYIPLSALNSTTSMNSSSPSVQVNSTLIMTSFVEFTKSKKENRTHHRVATTALSSSLFSSYIKSHGSANVSLFLVNDSSTSLIWKTTTTIPIILNSTSAVKELNSTKLVKSLRTLYQTSFFYITTSLNATVIPSKTILLNTSTQKSDMSMHTELITAHSNTTIPQTVSLVVPSYITNSTDEQYSRTIQTKSYYSTPVLNTTLLSTLFGASISHISLPEVGSTFEVPRTSLKIYNQSSTTEVIKIFSTPSYSPSVFIMSTITTSRTNVTTTTMREKNSTSSFINQTEWTTSFPISFISSTLLRTKSANSTPSTTFLFNTSYLLSASSVYRIQNSTSQSLTKWKNQSSQFLEKSMSSSLISSESSSIVLLITSVVPSLTPILDKSSDFIASKSIHESTIYNISSNYTLITKSSANVSVPTIWSSLHFTSHSPLNGSFYFYTSSLPSSSPHSSFSWSFSPPPSYTFSSIVLSSFSSFYPPSFSFIFTPSLSYHFPLSSSQLLHSSSLPPFLSPSIIFSYHSTPYSVSSSLSHSPFYSSLSNYSSTFNLSESPSYSTSHFFNQSSSHFSSIFLQSFPSYMFISSFTSLLNTSTSFISLLPSRFSSSLAPSHHFNTSIKFSLSSYYQKSSSFSSSFFLTSLSLNSSLHTLPIPVPSSSPSSSQFSSIISSFSFASSSSSSPHIISSTSSYHSIKSGSSSHRTFFKSSPVTQTTSLKYDQTSTSVTPTLQTSKKASQGIKTFLHTTPYWKLTTKKQTQRTYETVSIISASVYPTSYSSEVLSQTARVGPHKRVHRTIHGRHDSWCSIMFVLLMLFFVTSSILIAYAVKWKGMIMTRFHDTIEPDQHDDDNDVGDEDETLRQYIKLKENTHTIIQVKSRSESVENEVPTPKYAWGRVSKNSCRDDDDVRGEDNQGYDSGGEGCSSKDNTNNGKMYKFC